MEVLTRGLTGLRRCHGWTLALSAPAVALSLLAACGGENSTGPAPTCATTPPRGTMTAQVAGTAFTADFLTQATIQNSTALGPNIVQITGAQCIDGSATRVRQILITVGRLTPVTPGTYNLDAASQGQPAGSGYSGIGSYVVAPNLWYSNISDATGPGSGSVTFTTVTATRVAGTFTLVAAAAGSNTAGNTARTTITSGSFDIPTP